MRLLEERIQKDGNVKSKDVLKVDAFLNHQMDIKLFTEMVQGLTANVEHCKAMTEKSTALATMVSAFFGYEVGTKVAHLAIDENITCKEATKKLGILPDDVIEEIFDPANLVNAEKLEALSVKYRSYRHI